MYTFDGGNLDQCHSHASDGREKNEPLPPPLSISIKSRPSENVFRSPDRVIIIITARRDSFIRHPNSAFGRFGRSVLSISCSSLFLRPRVHICKRTCVRARAVEGARRRLEALSLSLFAVQFYHVPTLKHHIREGGRKTVSIPLVSSVFSRACGSSLLIVMGDVKHW